MTGDRDRNGEADIRPFIFRRSTTDEGFWELDRNLPRWARRSNPIVRRHLGGFLAAPLPQLDILGRLLLWQIVLVLLSLLIPAILELMALLALVAIIALPVALYSYAVALFGIGRSAANAMMDELEGRGLDTLRTTPLTLRSILLSKIAASLWTQAINMEVVILITAVLSLPVITIQQASLYPPEKFLLPSRALIIAGLIASLLRVFVEPLMMGALGVLAGAVAGLRVSAITWTILLGVAYFVMINLPRLAILTWPERLVIESVLPVLLPILITIGSLALARVILEQD
ncbi:MAG: hypothetical protein HPY64_03620 [Anaerolineae bacterium]|nr:hypothetical protein [Anaerolineae bacterium]